MGKLDRTQQRIIGVLIEKQRTVPDTYPLTENAIVAGCNQKNNRDPQMSLHDFEVHGALMALELDDWVKASTGARAKRYAHRVEATLGLDDAETAVICELLVRGPQAPGALKPRVARLGFHADVPEIEAVLHRLAARPTPLVEQQPRRPRERDQRWGHLLGPTEVSEAPAEAAPDVPEPAAVATPAPGLDARVARLEARVEELEAALRRIGGSQQGAEA